MRELTSCMVKMAAADVLQRRRVFDPDWDLAHEAMLRFERTGCEEPHELEMIVDDLLSEREAHV